MKRFILFLSAVAIILVMTVSCSKDETNDVLPVVGYADLNGQKKELTYSLLSKLNVPRPPGLVSSSYVIMLAGGMNAQGSLTKEPYLFASLHNLPEKGSQITFDLNEENITLRCILGNKEYQYPTDMKLPIVSGTLKLQRDVNDSFHLEFDIRMGDGNIFSGNTKLNYIP